MPKELVQRLSLQLQAALQTTRPDQLFGQVQTDIPRIGSQPLVWETLELFGTGWMKMIVMKTENQVECSPLIFF